METFMDPSGIGIWNRNDDGSVSPKFRISYYTYQMNGETFEGTQIESPVELSLIGFPVAIGSSNIDVKIKAKTVSWKSNGDGTYTLIGK
jgi:hypothetical protein